jgi:hypothetical protein
LSDLARTAAPLRLMIPAHHGAEAVSPNWTAGWLLVRHAAQLGFGLERCRLVQIATNAASIRAGSELRTEGGSTTSVVMPIDAAMMRLVRCHNRADVQAVQQPATPRLEAQRVCVLKGT